MQDRMCRQSRPGTGSVGTEWQDTNSHLTALNVQNEAQFARVGGQVKTWDGGVIWATSSKIGRVRST